MEPLPRDAADGGAHAVVDGQTERARKRREAYEAAAAEWDETEREFLGRLRAWPQGAQAPSMPPMKGQPEAAIARSLRTSWQDPEPS